MQNQDLVNGIVRRSRHDQSGRDFKCQICERTYLSYPAMHQHMKNKHQVDPQGSNAAMVSQSRGRGRGRPKKNFSFDRIDPTSEQFLRTEKSVGGPTEASCGFEQCFKSLYCDIEPNNIKYQGNYQAHPLYQSLIRFDYGRTPGPTTEDLNGESDPTAQGIPNCFKSVSLEISQMNEEYRVMLSMDEILSAYLREASSKVNSTFYRKVLQFGLLYRDCMNQYGWQKLAEAECRETKVPLDDVHIQSRLERHKDLMDQHEFTVIKNGEVGPEICNEFVTVFMANKKESEKGELERNETIDLTRHFCHWLFINGHTCSKLSLI